MYTTTPYGERIIISSSTVRHLFKKGEEQIVCPSKTYDEVLARTRDRKYREDKSNPLIHGQYFETKCIGSGREGNQVLDLARKKVSKAAMLDWAKKKDTAIREGLPIPPEPKGLMHVYHERIDHQVNQFKLWAPKYGVVLIPNVNTQIRIFKQHPDFEHVMLRCDIDFLSPFNFSAPHGRTKVTNNVALVDLKLTADVNNVHDFNHSTPWGEPHRLDVTQLIFYNEMVKDIDYELNEKMNPGSSASLKMLFEPIRKNIIESGNLLLIYWVFDYGKAEQNWKLVEVTPTEARRKELWESIRKTVRKIEEMRDDGFPTNPIDSICSSCGNDKCKQKSDYISI